MPACVYSLLKIMSREASTKKKLLSLIDDVEIVSRELLELLSSPKQQRADGVEMSQLVELLVQKDNDIKEALKTAQEQAELQRKYEALKAEVEKRDQDIRQLQRCLKEAETVMATAIYQAKQKLQSISQAKSRRISSEELIKYANKISASNAVAAPPTWAPGDPRRPYPTDMDMRCGLLGNQAVQAQGNYPEGLVRSQSLQEHTIQPPQPHAPSSLSWTHSLDTQHTSGYPQTVTQSSIDSKSHKDTEDVELMSSDSSSSSSSDE